MTVTDEPFAIHCLKHHNYYRLSAYSFTFTVSGNPDQFKPDITFQQLWELYCFDRTLRQRVLEACKRVEISVRSRWAYEVGHQLDPLAYLESRNFKNRLLHARAITNLDDEMNEVQPGRFHHPPSNHSRYAMASCLGSS